MHRTRAQILILLSAAGALCAWSAQAAERSSAPTVGSQTIQADPAFGQWTIGGKRVAWGGRMLLTGGKLMFEGMQSAAEGSLIPCGFPARQEIVNKGRLALSPSTPIVIQTQGPMGAFGGDLTLDQDYGSFPFLFVKLHDPLPPGGSVAKTGSMLLHAGEHVLKYRLGSREYIVRLSVPQNCGA